MARIPAEAADAGAPKSAHEYALEAIGERLVTGDLEPGQRVSPDEIAESLGISHIPVREAIRALEGGGHLVRKGRRGTFVPELSLSDLEDLYLWRGIVEDAAHRIALPNITEEDLSHLRDLVEQMEQIEGQDRQPLQYARLNREFHFVVFRRTESERAIRMISDLWDAAARYYAVHLQLGTRLRELNRHHRQLLQTFSQSHQEGIDRSIDIMSRHRGVTLNELRAALRADAEFS